MSLLKLLTMRATVHSQYKKLATRLGFELNNMHRIIYMLYQRDLIPSSLSSFNNLTDRIKFKLSSTKSNWSAYNKLGVIAHVSQFNVDQCALTNNYLEKLLRMNKHSFQLYCETFDITFSNHSQMTLGIAYSNHPHTLPQGSSRKELPAAQGSTTLSSQPSSTISGPTDLHTLPSVINPIKSFNPYAALVIEYQDPTEPKPSKQTAAQGKASDAKKNGKQRKKKQPPTHAQADIERPVTEHEAHNKPPSIKPGTTHQSRFETINEVVNSIDSDDFRTTPKVALALAVYAAECGDIDLITALCAQHPKPELILYGICRESKTLIINIAIEFFHFNIVTFICEQIYNLHPENANDRFKGISMSSDTDMGKTANLVLINGKTHPILSSLNVLQKNLSQPNTTLTRDDITLTEKIMGVCIYLIEKFELSQSDKESFCAILNMILKQYPVDRRPLLSPLFQSIFNSATLCSLFFDFSSSSNRKSTINSVRLIVSGLSFIDLLGSKMPKPNAKEILTEISTIYAPGSPKTSMIPKNLTRYLFNKKNDNLIISMIMCLDGALKEGNATTIAFYRFSIQYFILLLEHFYSMDYKAHKKIVHEYLTCLLTHMYLSEKERGFPESTRKELCKIICENFPETRLIKETTTLFFLTRISRNLSSEYMINLGALFGSSSQIGFATQIYCSTHMNAEAALEEDERFLAQMQETKGRANVIFCGVQHFIITKNPIYLEIIMKNTCHMAPELPIIYQPVFEQITRHLININKHNQTEQSTIPFLKFCFWLLSCIEKARIIFANPSYGDELKPPDRLQVALVSLFGSTLPKAWRQRRHHHLLTTLHVTQQEPSKEQQGMKSNESERTISQSVLKQLDTRSLCALAACAKKTSLVVPSPF